MKLVILLPTSGKVHTQFMTSLIGLTQALQRDGIPFGLKHYEFSDLVMSRNYMVSYFLSQTEFTHALLLDSDLAFAPDQFYRLKNMNVDFSAAAYPDRRITGPVIADAIAQAKPHDLQSNKSVNKLLARHMRYIVTQDLGSDIELKAKVKGDFMTTGTVATGFMLISRNVVESIVANDQARALPRTGRLGIYQDAPRFYDFFSHLLTPENDAFYGEDQSFCRRWVLGCGGDIWVDRGSKVSHIGEFIFHGDYSHKSGLNQE